jgi:hypothetical protein
MTNLEVIKKALDRLEDIFGKNKVDVGAITALRQAIEQLEKQKPVAWMYVNFDDKCEQIEYGEPFEDPSVTPLYAAPPARQWVGLTKEEAADCWSNEAVRTWHAIEDRLKEKNT